MKKEEKRSYVFKLQRRAEETTSDLMQYYKDGSIDLGKLQIHWIGNCGERNIYTSKAVKVPYKTAYGTFPVLLVNPPSQLILEEPIILSLKITNASPNTFNFKFSVDDEANAIAINALSLQVRLYFHV